MTWRPRSSGAAFPSNRITAGFTNWIEALGRWTALPGERTRRCKRLARICQARNCPDYEKARNHPEVQGTSRLSPYLHFGNIGPLTIALAVKKAVAEGKASPRRGTGFWTS